MKFKKYFPKRNGFSFYCFVFFFKSMLQSFLGNSLKQIYWKIVMTFLAFGHFCNFNLRKEKSQNNKYISPH